MAPVAPGETFPMTRPIRCFTRARRVAMFTALMSAAVPALSADYPVTPQQRSTAQQVAQSGVPLADLAPNAPDAYTVKRGDTLWDISQLYLRSPWRWPELWGMNLDEIRNPHLIYPGQVLYLDKAGGRARLRLAQPVEGATTKLSPRVRSEPLDRDPITSIPMHLIGPFLNEAVVFNSDELAAAPRVVAMQEDRVIVARGELAYVRGDIENRRDWRVFRNAKPLVDPVTREVLGYEAAFVGTAEYVRAGEVRVGDDGKASEIVPATFSVTGSRLEIGVGDRLSPVPARDFGNYAPHAPTTAISGRVISIYGDGLNAGQNQIVAINKGAQDGMERGHVLALLRDGRRLVDSTDEHRAQIKLPDERNGLLFVFRVFERVSYGLIVSVQVPVSPGDRFSQP
jgi:hypothetical protein